MLSAICIKRLLFAQVFKFTDTTHTKFLKYACTHYND